MGLQLRFCGVGSKKGSYCYGISAKKSVKGDFRLTSFGGGVHEVLFPLHLPPPTSLGDQTDTLLKDKEKRGNLNIFPANMHSSRAFRNVDQNPRVRKNMEGEEETFPN